MSAGKDDTTALPQTCVRCSGLAMLRIVGRCADCIADMGLRQPAEHARWLAEVKDVIGATSRAGA